MWGSFQDELVMICKVINQMFFMIIYDIDEVIFFVDRIVFMMNGLEVWVCEIVENILFKGCI